MFLNPYGLEGLQFLWMLRTRLSAGNVFAETINELRSPFDAAVSNVWPVGPPGIFNPHTGFELSHHLDPSLKKE